MISKDNFSAEHIRELQLHNHRDPLLLERTLFAFGLLEALVKVGIPVLLRMDVRMRSENRNTSFSDSNASVMIVI